MNYPYPLLAIVQAPACQNSGDFDVAFIRLLFKSRVQEEIAFRWASRLGEVIGPRVMQLRPETTLSEILKWCAVSGADSMSFITIFRPELQSHLNQFVEIADDITFREMVEHYARYFEGCAD